MTPPFGDLTGRPDQGPLTNPRAERVRQVATNRYLWVQVRSAERTTAYEVLDGVTAPGY